MLIDEWLNSGIPEAISLEAAQWLVLQDSEDITPEQEKALQKWLEQDPLHQLAYEELSTLWVKSLCLRPLQKQIDSSIVLNFPPPGTNSKAVKQRTDVWGWIAAVLVVASLLLCV